MVRGSGGSVCMGCVDMQVRRSVIFVLGHCVRPHRGNVLPAATAVFRIAFEYAEQSYTQPPECFKEVSVPGWSSEAVTPFLNNVQYEFWS
jgi:hypothetical protein